MQNRAICLSSLLYCTAAANGLSSRSDAHTQHLSVAPHLQVLDDLPLSRSTQGSSTLTARKFLDNFSHLPVAEGSATLPLFADPQVCAAVGAGRGLVLRAEFEDR